jgi:alpha-ketoglutarate-dependent taurine dioxygenase
MKNTQPIDFPGIENILKNINLYKKKFLEDSVIVFRNANLTYDEQSYFHNELSKLLNYNIILKEDNKADMYLENHAKTILTKSAQKDEILLSWHLEHVYYKNPIVISTWNMTKFKTDNENGKTYFLDCEKAYNEMPEDWKNFLSQCRVSQSLKQGPKETIEWDSGRTKNSDKDWKENNYCPVSEHWITENPTLRLAIIKEDSSILYTLVSVDDRDPTELEVELFEEIIAWFAKYVYTNEDERIVHKWQEGDLLIVDIFKLAHAVTGGFNPEDREFIGMWGYKNLKD